MHALCAGNKVTVELVHEERSNRSGKHSNVYKHLVEGFVGRFFVGGHLPCPVTLAVKAHVPVGDIVADKCFKDTAGRFHVIVLISRPHVTDDGIELGKDPTVQLIDRKGFPFCHRSPAVNVCIPCKEGVSVIQGAEELAADIAHAALVKLEVVPGLCVCEHVPAEGIGPVIIQSLERIHGVSKAL